MKKQGTMSDHNTPQWLREVLRRGFKPKKIYHLPNDALYGFVAANSGTVSVFDKKLYALEGLPGAGKTSLAILLTRGNKRMGRVPQILPTEPANDQAMGQAYYFRSEELKTRAIMRSPKKEFVLDRYYPSTLAFYWAYDRVKSATMYQTALRWYRRALVKKLIIKPWRVFYIDLSVNVSSRRKERVPARTSPNMWLNVNFLRRFRQYYVEVFPKLEPQTEIITLPGTEKMEALEAMIRNKL
ncbi:MAG: hypothetical protein WC497_02630 [Patescibacteria group bacterium]